jgi:Flp pilus assembly pilin Flp
MAPRFTRPSRPLARDRGQSLVEYTLILALAAIVVIAVLSLMGRQILAAFQNVSNTMQGP